MLETTGTHIWLLSEFVLEGNQHMGCSFCTSGYWTAAYYHVGMYIVRTMEVCRSTPYLQNIFDFLTAVLMSYACG